MNNLPIELYANIISYLTDRDNIFLGKINKILNLCVSQFANIKKLKVGELFYGINKDGEFGRLHYTTAFAIISEITNAMIKLKPLRNIIDFYGNVWPELPGVNMIKNPADRSRTYTISSNDTKEYDNPDIFYSDWKMHKSCEDHKLSKNEVINPSIRKNKMFNNTYCFCILDYKLIKAL